MFKFILVSIILLLWLITVYRQKKTLLIPSAFVILLYSISVFLSYPHVIFNNELLSLNPEYFGASIVFLLLLFLFLFPFVSFREDKIKIIQLPHSQLLNGFSISIVILSLFSIVYFTPVVITVFSMGNFNDAREGMLVEGAYVTESIFNTIASVSSSFYTIAIFLFFIYRAKGTNKTLSVLLLISSVSYVFNVFAYAGRDGVVFWLFSFVASYGLFRDFLPQKDRGVIKKVLFVFLVLTVPMFMAISTDRFSDNVFGGLLSYIGQSFPNFCLSYHADYPVSYGASFPLFRELLGLSEAVGYSGEYGGTFTWVFGTFLKSLIVNFDVFATVIIGITMGVIFLLGFKKSDKVFTFHQFFLYFLYFNVYSQGVFYFKQTGRGGNLFIILSFLFYFVFMIINKNTKIKSDFIFRKSKRNDALKKQRKRSYQITTSKFK